MSAPIRNTPASSLLNSADFGIGSVNKSGDNTRIGKEWNPKSGVDFRKTLTEVQQKKQNSLGQELLGPQMSSTDPLPKASEGVKFSQHALDRMVRRGISFSPTDMERLNEAVLRAAQKGSRDSLVLFEDRAAIVSVKNNMIVTVMDRAALKENVFTNIDSTIVLKD